LELNETYRKFQIVLQQGNVIRNTILPKAEQYLLQTKEGFEKGRYEYLEVLEARRKLIDTQESYIRTLLDLAGSVANLERLCSTSFHGVEGGVFRPCP